MRCLISESFELLLKFGKSSFLRKQESSLFKTFWIPAYAGMTKWGYFSKLSRNHAPAFKAKVALEVL